MGKPQMKNLLNHLFIYSILKERASRAETTSIHLGYRGFGDDSLLKTGAVHLNLMSGLKKIANSINIMLIIRDRGSLSNEYGI